MTRDSNDKPQRKLSLIERALEFRRSGGGPMTPEEIRRTLQRWSQEIGR